MAETDAYLFGRKTYEKMVAFWPTAPSDDPFAAHLNGTTKYVVSTTLAHAEWQNTTVIAEDVVKQLTRLKQLPGKNIAVLASGQLVQTLIAHDLVD